MAIFDEDAVFLKVNDAFTDAFGYRRDQIVGRHSAPLIAPGDRAQWELKWQALLHDGRGDCVHEFMHADGYHVRIHGVSERGRVAGRSLVLSAALAAEPLERILTKREAELVGHVAAGKRAHQIAAELFLSTSTVQTHLRNAMAKMGARSQAQLVALALRRGELGAERLG
jgi:PAS domain S-box-containing protein